MLCKRQFYRLYMSLVLRMHGDYKERAYEEIDLCHVDFEPEENHSINQVGQSLCSEILCQIIVSCYQLLFDSKLNWIKPIY